MSNLLQGFKTDVEQHLDVVSQKCDVIFENLNGSATQFNREDTLSHTVSTASCCS